MPRRHSISLFLVIIMTLGLLIPLVIGMFMSFNAERQRLADELQEYQEVALEALVQSTVDSLLTFSPDTALSAASVLFKDDRVVRVKIYSSIYGMFLVRLDKEPPGSGYDIQALRMKIEKSGESLGYAAIAVNRGWIESQLRPLQDRLFILFGAMFLGGLVLVVPTVYWRIIKPLRRLKHQAVNLSHGNLADPCQWDGKDEFATLGRTMETMRNSLNANFRTIMDMAVTDELTSLPNRRAVMNEMPRFIAASDHLKRDLAVAIMDLDHFKQINDTYGHQAGDDILRAFSLLILGNIRRSDFWARYGGEEFILCLPETDITTAVARLNSLRERVEAHAFEPDRQVTVSIGVSLYRPGMSLDELLQNADLALYRAKESGRNRVEAFGWANRE